MIKEAVLNIFTCSILGWSLILQAARKALVTVCSAVGVSDHLSAKQTVYPPGSWKRQSISGPLSGLCKETLFRLNLRPTQEPGRTSDGQSKVCRQTQQTLSKWNWISGYASSIRLPLQEQTKATHSIVFIKARSDDPSPLHNLLNCFIKNIKPSVIKTDPGEFRWSCITYVHILTPCSLISQG